MAKPPDDATLQAMIAAARAAREHAYAPYSRFQVGACVLTDTGRLHAGANVENAAYPQGHCAEASAIGRMVTDGDRRIAALVVVGTGDLLCSPCGGCRQRINEFARPDTPVLMCTQAGRVLKRATVAELLPYAFGPENLEG